MRKDEFMDLKRLYLEGQERQELLEKDLEKALNSIAFMQELLANLLREIQFARVEHDEGGEIEAMPPDFILKSGERLEMN